MTRTALDLAKEALVLLRIGRTHDAEQALEALVAQLGASDPPPPPPGAPVFLQRLAARPAPLLPQPGVPARFIPAFAKAAQELDQHIARLGAERVAALLHLERRDLDTLLTGQVGISPTWLHRLRLEDPDDDAS